MAGCQLFDDVVQVVTVQLIEIVFRTADAECQIGVEIEQGVRGQRQSRVNLVEIFHHVVVGENRLVFDEARLPHDVLAEIGDTFEVGGHDFDGPQNVDGAFIRVFGARGLLIADPLDNIFEVVDVIVAREDRVQQARRRVLEIGVSPLDLFADLDDQKSKVFIDSLPRQDIEHQLPFAVMVKVSGLSPSG